MAARRPDGRCIQNFVVGGGPIGCELAQAFRRLGSEVTIVGRDDRLLPRDDVDAVDASAILKIQFEREGIELLLGAERVAAARVKAAATLSLARGGKREPRSSDAVLVATGRTLNLDGLGLDIARITITERGIEVDDLRTTNRRVYAAGDVASRWFAS